MKKTRKNTQNERLNFKYQLTRYMKMESIKPYLETFMGEGKDKYGKTYIIKRHKNKKVYAIFTKGDMQEKEVRTSLFELLVPFRMRIRYGVSMLQRILKV